MCEICEHHDQEHDAKTVDEAIGEDGYLIYKIYKKMGKCQDVVELWCHHDALKEIKRKISFKVARLSMDRWIVAQGLRPVSSIQNHRLVVEIVDEVEQEEIPELNIIKRRQVNCADSVERRGMSHLLEEIEFAAYFKIVQLVKEKFPSMQQAA